MIYSALILNWSINTAKKLAKIQNTTNKNPSVLEKPLVSEARHFYLIRNLVSSLDGVQGFETSGKKAKFSF